MHAVFGISHADFVFFEGGKYKTDTQICAYRRIVCDRGCHRYLKICDKVGAVTDYVKICDKAGAVTELGYIYAFFVTELG